MSTISVSDFGAKVGIFSIRSILGVKNFFLSLHTDNADRAGEYYHYTADSTFSGQYARVGEIRTI
jgi:hypothetical protein